MSSRKRRALVALQLREKGKWVPGKKEEAQLPQVPKPTPARAGTKAGSGKAAAGMKAGAGKAGAGKAAAVPPTKRSSPRFQEEVTSSGSSDVGLCWRFSGPKRILIRQAHRITVVALHHGVFQGIVFFLREAL